jgi:hypothetical protein
VTDLGHILHLHGFLGGDVFYKNLIKAWFSKKKIKKKLKIVLIVLTTMTGKDSTLNDTVGFQR